MLLPLKQHHLPHNGPSDSVQLAKWCHLPDLLRRHDCVQVARGLGVHCPNLRARARRAKQCGLCEQVATEGPKAAAGWEAFLERMHFPACVLAELGAGEAQGLQTLVDSTDDTGHRCRLTAALREPCWKRPAPPPTRPWGLWAWNGKSWLDAVTFSSSLLNRWSPRGPQLRNHIPRVSLGRGSWGCTAFLRGMHLFTQLQCARSHPSQSDTPDQRVT